MARFALRTVSFLQETCPVPDYILGNLYAAQEGDPTTVVSVLPAWQRAQLAVFCHGRTHLRHLARVVAATCEEAELIDVGGRLGSWLFHQSRIQKEPLQPRKRPITLPTLVPSHIPTELYEDDESEATLVPTIDLAK